MSTKVYLDQDVYSSTLSRLDFLLDHFPKFILSFSGGKDSSILLQLLINRARLKDRLPVDVLYIDFEAQYKATINHVEELLVDNPDVNPYWICLPVNLRNSVSVYQSQWQPWNPDKQDIWVREMPEFKGVISDSSFLPFFYYGIEFEDFVVDFAKWYSKGELSASIIAIRTDESINRFRTIRNTKKETFQDLSWTTRIIDSSYNVYPIYDWRTEDVWTAVGRFDLKYNKIYDLMYAQGKSIHESRLCQPFGDDQRRGLDLFRTCEPDTWDKIVGRVSGSNYGNMYANTFLLGRGKVLLPEGHTWKSYTEFLLATLPRFEAEWYKIKFKVFFDWWAEKGNYLNVVYDDENKTYNYVVDTKSSFEDGLPKEIPDTAERKLESKRKLPTWRRIAEVIVKNDKLCKRLTFSGTKNQFAKYEKLRDIYGY
ncbi:MAG: DUF3440 domain-containing protein [Candidatus Kariarchaeaceae archaeon]